MTRTFVTNPLTGRTIQVGGTTFNRLVFVAYDFINGELIRRESAPPISPIEYYYNISTGRRIIFGSRRYFELMRAGWDIEDDYYLIPPLMDMDLADIIIDADRRRRNLPQREPREPPAEQPITFEQIMVTHRDALANLNITLCRECFYPIKAEEGEYCNDCKPK